MAARALLLRVLVLMIAAAIFLATGEIALRIIYRDAGKRTLGGPGGRSFEHLTIRDDLRGRFDVGAKTPGKPRIMILGDSITWGQGVRNWEDVWPEQLGRILEGAGTPHDIAVFALPGRDIPAHVQQMQTWGEKVQPDVFIYQWYVNDLEVASERPRDLRSWQRWPGHDTLRRWSYLYYFLDNRLAMFLPPPDRSYVQYIVEDYVPGSVEWAEFERYFHELATRAKALAPLRLMVIYPQVPFRGRSPLQSIYDRVAALATAERLSIPPAAWVRYAGALVARADAPWRQGVQITERTPGGRAPIVETREYYLPAGRSDILIRIAVDKPVFLEGRTEAAPLASLELVDTNNQVIGTAGFGELFTKSGWQDARVGVDIPVPGRSVKLRVSTPYAGLTLGAIELPADYGFRVVDLTPALNTFNTHASIFDAHPNERAHRVIAEEVARTLQQAEAHR